MVNLNLGSLIVDLSFLTGLYLLTPWLGKILFEQSSLNYLFLLPGFLIMFIGILAIRSIPSYDKSLDGVGFLGSFFVLIVFLLLFTSATNIGGSSAGNEGYAVIGFFVCLPFLIGAYATDVEEFKKGKFSGELAALVALFCVNYFTIIGTALWEHFYSLPTVADPVYATGIAFLILYAVLYILFIFFFGLPRLYLFFAHKDFLSLVMYLGGLAIYLWDKVPPVN